MATKTYEKTYDITGVAAKVIVTANETDTTWSLTNIKVMIQKGGSRIHLKLDYAKWVYVYGQTPPYTNLVNVTGTPSDCGFVSDGNYWSRTITYSSSFNKSKDSEMQVCVVYDIYSVVSGTTHSLGAGQFITVPKWTSFPVTFSANGGTNAPSTQTKYYGESLNLSSTTPTRSGYRFVSWNTNADGSGTSYTSGATYSTNAPLALYAQWQSAAKPPTISSMSVIRCDSSRAQDDSGTYCLLTVRWSVDTAGAGLSENTGVVSGTIKADSSSSSMSITFDSGTTGGTSNTSTALISSVSTDEQYLVTVKVTNSKYGTGQSTKLSTSRGDILTRSKFVMDFKAGGTGVGIGVAAPSDGLEVGWDTQFDEDVDILGNVTAANLKYSTSSVWGDIFGTLQSGWECSSVQVHKYGRLCHVYMTIKSTQARGAGSTQYVTYSTKAAYIPIYHVIFPMTREGYGELSQSGTLYFIFREAISANTSITFGFSYMSKS